MKIVSNQAIKVVSAATQWRRKATPEEIQQEVKKLSKLGAPKGYQKIHRTIETVEEVITTVRVQWVFRRRGKKS